MGVVERPDSEDEFPGLYATSLPENLFLGSDLALVTTQWGNRSEIAAINLKTGKVEALSDQQTWPNSSWTLLESKHGAFRKHHNTL
jgi:acylaminoacyl-peptidase